MFSLNFRRSTGVSVLRLKQLLVSVVSSSNYKNCIVNMSHEPQYPPIETAMRNALIDELKPVYLDVSNESPMHNTPKQAESHFRVSIVSEKFNDLTLIKRHRLVNDTIKKALQSKGFEFMHALSIEAKTPKQWRPEQEPEKSPPCLGGYGK